MKYCTQCDNMYYIGIDANDSNKLTYYCRNCRHIDSEITNDSLCVLKTSLKKGEQTFTHMINQYTKFDPTLPRIYNVRCPHVECATNKEGNKAPTEVIYMRYDDNRLKYLYICVTCDTVWKTDDHK